jgi:hypothetical protein
MRRKKSHCTSYIFWLRYLGQCHTRCVSGEVNMWEATKAYVACASIHISCLSSSLSPIKAVSTQPGATALILAFRLSRTISFFTPLTRPYCKPDLPEAYSVCPACPYTPVSLPVTMMAKFSISLPFCTCHSSAAARKCLIVRKVPKLGRLTCGPGLLDIHAHL